MSLTPVTAKSDEYEYAASRHRWPEGKHSALLLPPDENAGWEFLSAESETIRVDGYGPLLDQWICTFWRRPKTSSLDTVVSFDVPQVGTVKPYRGGR